MAPLSWLPRRGFSVRAPRSGVANASTVATTAHRPGSGWSGVRQVNRSDPQQRSWLQRWAGAVAAWLLAPSRRRQTRRQAALRQQLEALLRPLVAQGAADTGLAVLEGALALAMADAEFHNDEWELYTSGLALLHLQDQQRSSLSLHGAVDLAWVCSQLEALADPAQRTAVGRFYALLSDADGALAAAEQRLLGQLLQALGLEARAVQGLALAAGASLLPPGPLERLRCRLAVPLQRWATPRRSRRPRAG